MANELSVSVSATYRKGTGDAQVNISIPYTDQITVSGTEVNRNNYSIGTSSEAIPLGDIGTPGFVVMRNLDGTNFITISTDSSAHANPVVKLKAGEVALFRANAALYAKADTAACVLEVTQFED